jgi:hypothetical protein
MSRALQRIGALSLAGLLLALAHCAGKTTREQVRADSGVDAPSQNDGGRDADAWHDGTSEAPLPDARGGEEAGFPDVGGCSAASLPPGVPGCGHCSPGTVCCAPYWCTSPGCPAPVPECVFTGCVVESTCPTSEIVSGDGGS